MRERFSAIGTRDLWVLSSLKALINSGFEYIKYDPNINELTGEKDGKLQINFNAGNNKTILEILSSSPKDIEEYKDKVAQEYSKLQSKSPQEIEEEYKALITKSDDKKEDTVWYKSEWFILLICVLVPPVGIYLIHKFGLFKTRERKIITGFFAIYTVLWLWLLLIPFINRSQVKNQTTTNPTGEEIVEENPHAANELSAYWSQTPVVNYTTDIPGLMDQYENLYINTQLGTPAGNQEAEEVFNKIKELDDAVLGIGITNEDNSAYTLSQKVAESANLFNQAIEENRNAINSGDQAQIDSAMNTWTNAENTFYEINYLYDQANQSVNNTPAQPQE